MFVEGRSVIRRSVRYWAGLSTDLVIEQMLMRGIKATGGLTRGRGMTEVQRSVWIKSLSTCSQINQSMQDLTGTTNYTSEQHVEASPARVKKDREDTDKSVTFFTTTNHFVDSDKSFRNIVSGVVAHESVNAEEAVKVGDKILESMQTNITDHSFKRKEEDAITLGYFSKLDSTSNRVTVQIDPQILFQRLMYVDRSQRQYEHWRHVFLRALYVSNRTIRQPRCSQISGQGCVGRLFVESYSNPSTKINIKSTLRTQWWSPITSHTMVPRCFFSRDMWWLQALRVRQVWKMYGRVWWLHWWHNSEGHGLKGRTHQRRGQTNYVDVHCERSTKQ